jgi:energy-coupling factor transporter ATP-binding protein EcfA2
MSDGGALFYDADLGRWVSVGELNTNTVSKLTRALGIDTPRTATADDKRDALATAVVNGATLEAPAPRATVAPEPEPEPEPRPEPVAVTLPEPATLDDSDGLASARAALGVLGAADVTRLVADAVAAAVGKVRPTVNDITVNGAAPVRVEGRQHRVYGKVLTYLASGSHVYLHGPAGSGKSTLGRKLAEALGVQFGSMSLGPTPMASKLLGYCTADGGYVRTVFRDCVEHGGVFLIDELDASFPGTLVEVNEVLAAGPGDEVAFPDGMVMVHENFRCLGGGNTTMRGSDATYSARAGADGSTHTRFVFVYMGYDEDLEHDIVAGIWPDGATAWLADIRRWRVAVESHGLVGYVISPREAVQGARALAAGIDREDVLTECVFKGWDAETRRKVERA